MQIGNRPPRGPRLPARRTRQVAAAIFAVWIIATGYAFWHFQFSQLRPFTPPQNDRAFFDGEVISKRIESLPIAPAGAATLIHFWDPACPCSRFNDDHLRALVEQYAPNGIEVLVVPAPGAPIPSTGTLQARYGTAVRLAAPELRALRPPSSPAVAVVDNKEQLAYFGPYSTDGLCSADGGGFVEAVLDNLLAGRQSRQFNTLAFGCYCPWPTHNKERLTGGEA